MTKLDNTIVVFGGAGFIGTHLMAKLRKDGHSKVISVDIRDPKRAVDGVDYIKHDVRDLSALSFGDTVPTLYNLAAVHTTPGHEPWEYYDANVTGAIEIIKFARRHKTDAITFTSSISVYGPSESPKDETTALAPTSDYGRSKRMAELVFNEWLNEAPDRKLVVTRPAVVFGYGEGGNFTRLARMLSKGWFVYPGRRDTIKSCIFVEDLVSWILAAGERSERFILFNGAYTDRYTIENIVDTFRDVAFPKARTFMVPAAVLKVAASILRPFSAAGLGVHPDRIEKLMVSTNVLPHWAEAEGLFTQDRLRLALERWAEQTDGNFT